MERKDVPDLIHSLTAERSVFVNRLRLMSDYLHRLLVITAALSQAKSLYPHGGVNPNRITNSGTKRRTASTSGLANCILQESFAHTSRTTRERREREVLRCEQTKVNIVRSATQNVGILDYPHQCAQFCAHHQILPTSTE